MIALVLKLGVLALAIVAVVALIRALPVHRRAHGTWSEFEVSFDRRRSFGTDIVKLRPRRPHSDLPE